MVLAGETNTLTRKELKEAIYTAVPALSRRSVSQILDQFFDEIAEALERNETVKLRGFGVFKVQHKKERSGRNPKTGIDAVISSRRVIKFSAAPYVRAMTNGEKPLNISDEDEA